MPKRSRKKPDPNVAAYNVLAQVIATGEAVGKNPMAVALGRQGGLKGGKARAAKLSSDERKASAKKAAAARWKDRKKES